MPEPKLYDYICAAIFDGAKEATVFLLVLPETSKPEEWTAAMALPHFMQHWHGKGPCPGGTLHIGLPGESEEALLDALENGNHVWFTFTAVDLKTSGRPN